MVYLVTTAKTLFEKLISNDTAVRHAALNEIEHLDSAATNALLPELLAALSQEDRAYAAAALWRIGQAAAAAKLINFIGDPNNDLTARGMAAFVLERFATQESLAAAKRFYTLKSASPKKTEAAKKAEYQRRAAFNIRSRRTSPPPPSPITHDVTLGEGYQAIRILTDGGEVHCRLYPARAPQAAVLLIGGAGGGWDSPAANLYDKLCRIFPAKGLTCLRVRYRVPDSFDDCVRDVLAGLSYLGESGIQAVALVGHSLGGAVAIEAASRCLLAKTVVTLASQSRFADNVGTLGPECSILLLHGTGDQIIPCECSHQIFQNAEDPKEIKFLSGAGHNLDECAADVGSAVTEWILKDLTI